MNYDSYIRNIVNLVNSKRAKATGYLISGGSMNDRRSLTWDLIENIAVNDAAEVAHVDLHTIHTDDLRIDAIKRKITNLKKSGKSENRFLILESFESISDEQRMDAVLKLIGCQNSGINLVVSASEPIVHLVGLSEFMIRLLPSEKVLTDVYRLNTQKVLFSLPTVQN